MSCGLFALSNANSSFLSLSACLSWIPALEPVRKNCSTPLCRRVLITAYSVKHLYTGVKPPLGTPSGAVNGVVVIDQGRHTGAKPGRVLYGRGSSARMMYTPTRD